MYIDDIGTYICTYVPNAIDMITNDMALSEKKLNLHIKRSSLLRGSPRFSSLGFNLLKTVEDCLNTCLGETAS